MDNLYIQTTQNVEIKHDLASIGERMLSHLLDYAFYVAYFLIVIFIYSITKTESIAIMLFLGLPFIFYDLFFEIFFNGQNLGKMIMKIKVIKIDGSQPSMGSYFIRWIFRIVDNLLFTGAVALISIIISEKGQRMGDIAAGTTVIRTSRKIKLENTIHVTLPDDYKVVYPEVEYLLEKDIRTIKQVLDHLKANQGIPEAFLLTRNAKKALENTMNISSTLEPNIFLETVLKDYNHLNGWE